MWLSRITVGPEVFRRGGIWALLVAFMVLLASCSTGTVLTDNGSTEPAGKTVPPVVLQQIVGLPPGKLSDLKAALALAGGQRDIGVVEGEFQSGNFSLNGQFKALVESAGVRIVYQWQLRDAEGVLIQTIDGEDNAGLFTGSDPWAAVTPAVLDRIARSTTESMANKLSQLGYATRLSALHVPPAEYFALAGPDAHREVDFETLNGPGMAMAGLDMIAPEEDDAALAGMPVDPVPGEDQLAAAPEAAEPESKPETPEPASPAAKSGKPAIRAVAVIPVKGSPGGGNAELTAAMRKTLSAAGWPVVSKPQPDALTIVGLVKLAKQAGAEQSVSVRWEVQSPDGRMLGDVKQANRIPSGSLDRGWGDAAFAVAEAAATGIFDIVNRVK
jgi:hypothetical protein